jgi:hypothetical protein
MSEAGLRLDRRRSCCDAPADSVLLRSSGGIGRNLRADANSGLLTTVRPGQILAVTFTQSGGGMRRAWSGLLRGCHDSSRPRSSACSPGRAARGRRRLEHRRTREPADPDHRSFNCWLASRLPVCLARRRSAERSPSAWWALPARGPAPLLESEAIPTWRRMRGCSSSPPTTTGCTSAAHRADAEERSPLAAVR